MNKKPEVRTADNKKSAVHKNKSNNIHKDSNNRSKYMHSSSGRKNSSYKSRKKKNLKYRKIKLFYNIVFVAIVLFVIIYGALHIFTKKKSYRNEGLDYYNKGEYEAAIESFNKALNCKQWFSEEVDVDIMMYKADAYIMLSDFASAERTYSSIKSKYPEKYYDNEKIDFMIELTNALDRYKYGDYITTVACFNRAVEAGYTEMSMYAANCYENSGDLEKMKYNLDIYTGSFGYNADICYKYAAYYIAMEDYSNALANIEKGISFGESVYLQVFLYTQIICCSKIDDYEKAYELSNDYVEAYPDDKNGQDIRAWLDTRINPDTEVINDIFNQNGQTSDDTEDNDISSDDNDISSDDSGNDN